MQQSILVPYTGITPLKEQNVMKRITRSNTAIDAIDIDT
jgi:hypothetical protein